MLFLYTHTHSTERCQADKPEQVTKMHLNYLQNAAKAGVKPIATYAAPHEHTVYLVFEANDITALENLLTPMTLWGNAKLTPIISFTTG